jgi:hypothetical protein
MICATPRQGYSTRRRADQDVTSLQERARLLQTNSTPSSVLRPTIGSML